MKETMMEESQIFRNAVRTILYKMLGNGGQKKTNPATKCVKGA